LSKYQELKDLAAAMGRPLASLIVLAKDNDPYLAGRPGRRLDGAQWFANLWERMNIPNGVHLRRLHYLLVSTPGTVMPNGNTLKCWRGLLDATADARYLDLVPASDFVDRRASAPVLYEPDASESAACLLNFSAPWVPGYASAIEGNVRRAIAQRRDGMSGREIRIMSHWEISLSLKIKICTGRGSAARHSE